MYRHQRIWKQLCTNSIPDVGFLQGIQDKRKSDYKVVSNKKHGSTIASPKMHDATHAYKDHIHVNQVQNIEKTSFFNKTM